MSRRGGTAISRASHALVSLAVLTSAIGCSAYDGRYQYLPRPVDVPVAAAQTEDRAATVLVTLVGVRKRDAEAGFPLSVELRLRVENHSRSQLRLDPVSLRLFSANLDEFPPALVPEGALVLEPGETGVRTAYFPFPDDEIPGATDMAGLNARWTLAIGEQAVTSSATFTREREERRTYDPYPFGLGFPIIIHTHSGSRH